MKPHWGLALLVIIWTSADAVRSQSGFDVTADAIMLNSSVYNAEVKLAFQTIGKYLTTVAVVFDHPDIVRSNPLTYNVQGTYRNQLAIDHQGRVTLKQKFSRAYTYRVQFSTLVTAYLSDNRTLSKFLEGWIYVRVLDVVYFHANASDGVNVSSSAKIGNSVFDCNDVVAVDDANFINPVLTFSSYYSSTFRVNPDGRVTMKKDVTDVNPGRYSLRITAYYTLSFKNGSLYSGRVYQYIRFYILGCSSAEEGNLQFPILHSCQATTHPCVKYHPMFKGGEVVRKCSIAGETLTLDFSNCSVSKGDFSTPFAVVSFTFSGTTGSTYIAALPRIKRDVESLFYSQASSVTEFSAYRSYKYYGFTMAFLVKLKQGTNDSIIAEAYQSLVSARRLGYQYLRYNRESRVVRAFLPSPGCKAFSEMPDNFTQFVQICQQTPSSNCICANINPTPTMGCENETFVDVAPSPSVSPSPTPEPAIHFTR